MRFTSEQRLDDGVLEREFTLGEIPGILWTPKSASAPAPLILVGHPGGLHMMYPRLAARARHAAADGFAAATIELPGSGDRPRSAAAEQARADLRRALDAGEPVDDEIVDRLVLPLVEKAVPEWRAALNTLLSLPEIDGPVGYSGGVIAIGIRLAVVESRISADLLFAGSFVPRTMFEEARQVTIHCRSCCSGTTKVTTGNWPWTCSTPSAPRRRRCTPIWAGTPASRSSRGTTGTGSSPGACSEAGPSGRQQRIGAVGPADVQPPDRVGAGHRPVGAARDHQRPISWAYAVICSAPMAVTGSRLGCIVRAVNETRPVGQRRGDRHR